MTIKERIAEYLKKHPEGVDDDVLARNLNLSARQQANSRCRQLKEEGLVERRKVHGKIHNFWISGTSRGIISSGKSVKSSVTQVPSSSKEEDWF